ncbi:MAG: hypothetical protein R3304_06420 [Longimicrobiales bacterium]|nr:hypothetical protein [Longimicrobiales bacterium]
MTPGLRPFLLLVSALGLAAASGSGPLAAQEDQNRPNVFLDCEGRNCNDQYFRTEIGWVNWVNDQAVSDVHVIVTSTSTGAGGREYQLDFIGVDTPDSYEDQLLIQSLPTDTEREQLDALVEALGAGLLRFAASTGYRGLVDLVGTEAEGGAPGRLVSQDEVDDPWNLWVFRINADGDLEGETSEKTQRWSGSLNASRVSPTWKVNLNARFSYEEQEFELEESTFYSTQTDWGFNQLLAYALADHWSVGVTGQLARLPRFNQELRAEVAPAIEYSYFPYAEATRRSLTAFYKIGPAYRDYFEPTIYDSTTVETRWEQSLELELSQRQTWGEAGITMTGSHFLHDFELNNLSMRGDIELRIFRGFSVNARGEIEWVNDQIYLPVEDATDEETLLELQQRATDFNYEISVGFSIQFGSIFNNVVNNRFRGRGFRGFGRRFDFF